MNNHLTGMRNLRYAYTNLANLNNYLQISFLFNVTNIGIYF